jgi:hypothetical protein
MIHRFERQHLPALRDDSFDLRERRSRLGADHHFGGFIEGDARHSGGADRDIGARRTAEAGARAAADEVELSPFLARVPHKLRGLGFRGRRQRFNPRLRHAGTLPANGNTLAGLRRHVGSNTARTRICWARSSGLN